MPKCFVPSRTEPAPRRRIPSRTLSLACPKCGRPVVLNWMRSRKAPQTIKVGVHPYKGVPVEVRFQCPHCLYVVSLGFNMAPYDIPEPKA
jgi:predicted RNA-binding Zn-ribbon protein involved in translation (DUF1610 family)